MYTKEEQDNFRKLERLFILNHLGIVGDKGGKKRWNRNAKRCFCMAYTGI